MEKLYGWKKNENKIKIGDEKYMKMEKDECTRERRMAQRNTNEERRRGRKEGRKDARGEKWIKE